MGDFVVESTGWDVSSLSRCRLRKAQASLLGESEGKPSHSKQCSHYLVPLKALRCTTKASLRIHQRNEALVRNQWARDYTGALTFSGAGIHSDAMSFW